MVVKTDELDSLSNPTKGYIETALIKGMTSPSTMIISAPNLTQSVLQYYYLSCNLATISTNTISLYHKSGTDINISGIASNLKIQSTLTSSGTIELIADHIKFRKFTGAHNYYLNFPVGKSGTVALTSDISHFNCECEEVTLTQNDAELILNTDAQFKHIRGFLTDCRAGNTFRIYLGDKEYQISNGPADSVLFEFEYIDKDLSDSRGLLVVKYLKNCATSAMQVKEGLWIPQSVITEFPVDYTLTLSSNLGSSEDMTFVIFKYNY